MTKIDFWTRATLSELSICHDQTILGAGSVGPLASFFPQLVGFVRTSAIVRTLSEHRKMLLETSRSVDMEPRDQIH